MSDDTIRAALTLDALVEEVARAIDPDATIPLHIERDITAAPLDLARAALAAVAKRAGGALTLQCAAMDLHDCNGPDPVAALLRTLAEAAQQEPSHG